MGPVVQAKFETDLEIADGVRTALEPLAQKDLSKERVLENLKEVFGDDLHQITRKPAFARALLSQIRAKQELEWQTVTEVEALESTTLPEKVANRFELRHYTNKASLTLAPESVSVTPLFENTAVSVKAIDDVCPPPFEELLSSVSLATLQPSSSSTSEASVLFTNTTGGSTSGHTSALDWNRIGNVGDTFYALFLDGKSATGVVPNFIKDATYYAAWKIQDIPSIWASSDWLSSAGKSGEALTGLNLKGFEGSATDVVSKILSDSKAWTDEDEVEFDAEKVKRWLGSYENFELKIHGPQSVNEWKKAEGFDDAALKKKCVLADRPATLAPVNVQKAFLKL